MLLRFSSQGEAGAWRRRHPGSDLHSSLRPSWSPWLPCDIRVHVSAPRGVSAKVSPSRVRFIVRGIGSHHCEAYPAPFFGPRRSLKYQATKTIVSGPLWRGRRLRPTSRRRIASSARVGARWDSRPGISCFSSPPGPQTHAPCRANAVRRTARLRRGAPWPTTRPHAITIAELPAGRRDRDEDMLQALVTAGALVALADGEFAPVERGELLSFINRQGFVPSISQQDAAAAFDNRVRQLEDRYGARRDPGEPSSAGGPIPGVGRGAHGGARRCRRSENPPRRAESSPGAATGVEDAARQVLTGVFVRDVEAILPFRTCSPHPAANLHPSDPFDREREATMDDERLERLIDRLPRFLRSSIRWLRQPSMIWLRIPAGILLIAGGLLSFLPILGLWMLPLGAILLSDDFRSLRSLRTRFLDWVRTPPSALVRRLMVRQAPLRSFPKVGLQAN